MKLVFFFNCLNHHQVLLADEAYSLLGDDFKFVVTEKAHESSLKGGGDYSSRPYCIKSYESKELLDQCLYLAKTADVAVFGAKSLKFCITRAKVGKLSFEVSERWLKRGILNLLSIRLLRAQICYFLFFRNRPFYKLCSSAYAARDHYILRTYINKCYKWGYFTAVENNYSIEQLQQDSTTDITQLMWCARFLKLKHPELPIMLSERLKKEGYKFHLNMYGEGEELANAQALVRKLGLENEISFKGAKSNTDIIHAMREHDIYLFTSDSREGWGAVVNESMSNGCAIVASKACGSVPFLIKDGINGYTFDYKDINSLYNKVVLLLVNPMLRKKLACQAYKDMLEIWSPHIAIRNLMQLVNDLQNNHDSTITEGPCSKALPIYN